MNRGLGPCRGLQLDREQGRELEGPPDVRLLPVGAGGLQHERQGRADRIHRDPALLTKVELLELAAEIEAAPAIGAVVGLEVRQPPKLRQRRTGSARRLRDRVLGVARRAFLPQLEFEIPVVGGGQEAAKGVTGGYDSAQQSIRDGLRPIQGPSKRRGQIAHRPLHGRRIVGKGIIEHPLAGGVAAGQVEPRHTGVVVRAGILPLVEMLVEQRQHPVGGGLAGAPGGTDDDRGHTAHRREGRQQIRREAPVTDPQLALEESVVAERCKSFGGGRVAHEKFGRVGHEQDLEFRAAPPGPEPFAHSIGEPPCLGESYAILLPEPGRPLGGCRRGQRGYREQQGPHAPQR